MPHAVETLGGGSIDWLPVLVLRRRSGSRLRARADDAPGLGRWLYAVGGNPEPRADRHSRQTGAVAVYVLSGLAAGVGGLITAGLIDAGSPTAGDLAELDSIAAVIIGGAAFAGGRGNVGNALVGAFTIGVIRNALNLHNVNAFYQLMVIGVVVILAVEADVFRGYVESASASPAARMRRPQTAAAVLAIRGATKRFGAVDRARRRRSRGLGGRGARAARRQRRRQVDADQVHQRRAAPRRGTSRWTARTVTIHRPPTRGRWKSRGLPGPRALRQPEPDDNFYPGRELARRVAAALARVLGGARWRRRPRACSIGSASGSTTTAGRADVGRPAAGGRGQPRRRVRVEVVILDEPTAALGVRESRSVLDLILRLRATARR